MINRTLRLLLALVLTAIVMASLARAQLPRHLEAGLNLVDPITAAQSR